MSYDAPGAEQGRATQGVRLVNLKPGDKIASLAAIPREDESDSSDDAE